MELQRSVVSEICALCQNFLNHPRNVNINKSVKLTYLEECLC